MRSKSVPATEGEVSRSIGVVLALPSRILCLILWTISYSYFLATIKADGDVPTTGNTSIHSVTVGTPAAIPQNNSGDVWTPAWTISGDIYSPSDDTTGFPGHGPGGGNVMFNHIIGDQPGQLKGETVNTMPDYLGAMGTGPDGCTWKSCGCASIDGKLYLLVARHKYGGGKGAPDPAGRQTAQNASIIRSNDGGKSWVRSPKENIDTPMFPGRLFATAYFINYGQDGHEAIADQSDLYVYAISNNGFWDNGDSMILGRVLRTNLPNLTSSDWQFLKHGDGADDTNWSSKVEEASPVLSNPGHLGMTGAIYLPVQKCYFMIGWYYPAGSGKSSDSRKTCWDFYVAPHPWGPWRTVGSPKIFTPQGFYCPAVCPKFSSPDGSSLSVFTAGFWGSPEFYRLTTVPLGLQ